ncbi:MAG: hypothetical protein CFE41_11655 [Burkholderiales bacterium PBB2]|nr:MAG: hypothetical protein CFE41_11655 [Burkholderiales bacterium PBB2]
MATLPVVSVVMPVFNGAAFLAQAIDSVLAQTFENFELLVIDDGSSDESAAIAEAYTDPRLKLLRNDGNKGLPLTRNRGVELARGEFVAFLDSDDIALPQRLERQLAYFKEHPALVGLGASVVNTDARGAVISGTMACPGSPAFCQAMLLFRTYFHTSTFMARRQALLAHPFDLEIGLAEDYDVYLRMSKAGEVMNLTDVLVQYRVHGHNITSTKRSALLAALNTISVRELRALGLEPDNSQLLLHRHLEMRQLPPSRELLSDLENWLRTILAANEVKGVYDKEALAKVVGERWFVVCEDAMRRGFRLAWLIYQQSRLSALYPLRFAQQVKMLVRLVYPSKRQRK